MIKPLKPLNIIYLISSWLSISMIFIIGEVVIRFGVFSSIVIVCAFMLAFCASFLLQKLTKSPAFAIKKQSIAGRIIRSVRILEVYVLHLFVSGLIFHSLFQINIYISVFSTAATFLILASFLPNKKNWKQMIKEAKFTIISGLAIILPTYIYLQKGLESLYHNLLYYQPQVLNHDAESLRLLWLIAFFIFFAKLLWQGDVIVKYTNPSFKKGISKLLIAVFIFSTFLLAFATMNVVAITQNLEYSHANELFILLIKKLSPSLMFKMFCFVVYVGTLILFIDTLPQKVGERKSKTPFVLLLIAALMTVTVFHHYSLLLIYTFFGLLIGILVMVATATEVIRNIMSRK
ncbi:hypothetical protein MHB50_21230 [Siminovitchia sp. FSL H7-0308]|uniref:hypothetical protein n=1 Tax=unclassified Siminovitchia TaxID=2837530 RepID=UPI0030CEC877